MVRKPTSNQSPETAAAAPKTVPCTIVWCDAASHPFRDRNRHSADVITIEGVDSSDIEVILSQAGPAVGEGLDAHIVLRRSFGQMAAQLDLVPGEALVLAEIFAAIDPADLIRIAAALADSAMVIHPDAEAGK